MRRHDAASNNVIRIQEKKVVVIVVSSTPELQQSNAPRDIIRLVQRYTGENSRECLLFPSEGLL